MARPTDQEITAIEKKYLVVFSDPERRHVTLQGPHREAPGSDRRQSRRGNVARSLYCGFHKKEWATQGKQASIV